MAYTGINLWLIPEYRERIKAVFGNLRNWQRFCLIADELEAEIARII